MKIFGAIIVLQAAAAADAAAVQHGGLLAPRIVDHHLESHPQLLNTATSEQVSSLRRAIDVWSGTLVGGCGFLAGAIVAGAAVFFILKKKGETSEAAKEEEQAVEEAPAVANVEAVAVAEPGPEEQKIDYDKFMRLIMQQAAQKVGPTLAKGQACRSVLEQRVQGFAHKARSMILNELNGTAASLFQAVEAEEAMLLLDWNRAVAANFPPMATLLAGILSPAILTITYGIYVLQIAVVLLPVFALCLWAMITDWEAPCSIPTLFPWVVSQVTLTAILLVSNVMLVVKIKSGRTQLEAKAQEMHERLEKAGVREEHINMGEVGASGMRELFICNSVLLQQALVVEDGVRKSIWCFVTGVGTLLWMIMTLWTLVLVLGWTFIPGVTAFHPAAAKVAPDQFCGAWATVFSARLCSILTVLFFFPNLLTVFRWVSDTMVNSPSYSKLMLTKAQELDKKMLGLPVCQVLVKAFVLRGTSEVASAQLAVALHERAQLEKDCIQAKQTLAVAEARIKAIDEQAADIQKKTEELGATGFEANIKSLEQCADAKEWHHKGAMSVENAKKMAEEIQEATTAELERMVEQITEAINAFRESEMVRQAVTQAEDVIEKAEEKIAEGIHQAEEVAHKLQEMQESGELKQMAEEAVEKLEEKVEELAEKAEELKEEATEVAKDLKEKAEPAISSARAKAQEAASKATQAASSKATSSKPKSKK